MDAIAREPGDEKEQLLREGRRVLRRLAGRASGRQGGPPPREDRRLLGRLLGDVIGEQVGPETRERIETIRQTAVRFRRTLSDPALAGEAKAVKAGLEAERESRPTR